MASYKITAISDTTRQMDALGSECGKTYATREEADAAADRLDIEQCEAVGCGSDWEPVEYRVVEA